MDKFLNVLSKNRIKFILLFLSGFLGGLCVTAEGKLWLLVWFCLIPAFLIFQNMGESDEPYRFWKWLLHGFVFFLPYYMVCFRVAADFYPIDGTTKAMSVFLLLSGWLLYSVSQALAGGLAVALYGLASRMNWIRRFGFLRSVLLPALWTALEWTQTLGPLGVPWGRLSISLYDHLLFLQSASLFGCYFITFLIVFVNVLLGNFIYAVFQKKTVSFWIKPVAGALAVLILNAGFGALKISALNREKTDTLTVASIQGNYSSTEKWSGTMGQEIADTYSKLTKEAVAEGAEIVVWPEAAIPYDIGDNESVSVYLSGLAKKCGCYLLVGILNTVEGSNGTSSTYNAYVLVDPDGTVHTENIYAKRRPVPFGESIPWSNLILSVFPKLAETDAFQGQITAGKDRETSVMTTEYGQIGTLICFDSVFENLSRYSVKDGAQLLVLGTNDSWFDTTSGGYMHLAQAQMRSIECGRWMIRSANTGITALIAPTGEVTDSIPSEEAGILLGTVSTCSELTLYDMIGNIWVWVCIGYSVFMVLKSVTDGIRHKHSVKARGE